MRCSVIVIAESPYAELSVDLGMDGGQKEKTGYMCNV
jgi:hypothetical protein